MVVLSLNWHQIAQLGECSGRRAAAQIPFLAHSRAATDPHCWNKTRLLHHLAICALILMGCRSPKSASPPVGAVADLNWQIAKFNAERPGDMGITPIAQRVSRVEYASDSSTISCFDGRGRILFLVLTRQPDGQFKGSMRTKYHELPKPEGHSWGEVVADFSLPRDMFQQDGAANGSQPIRSETNRTSSAAGSRR